jgi:hypothetical protein
VTLLGLQYSVNWITVIPQIFGGFLFSVFSVSTLST